MQFLADENFPQPSIHLPRTAGFDVVAVREDALGIADTEVVKLTTQTHRTILTFDRDYGELVYRYNLRPPTGIIYFRWEEYQPQYPGNFLLDLLRSASLSLAHTFVVVMPNGQLRISTY